MTAEPGPRELLLPFWSVAAAKSPEVAYSALALDKARSIQSLKLTRFSSIDT